MSYLFYGSGDSGERPGHLAPGPEEPRHLVHPRVTGSAHMSYLFYGSGDSGERPGHLAPGPEEPRHLVPGSSHMSYLFYGSGDSGARPGHLAPGAEEPRHLDHTRVPSSAQARPLLLFCHHQVQYLQVKNGKILFSLI
jgi:hypothetical protein